MGRLQVLFLLLPVWLSKPWVVYCTRAQFQQEKLQSPSAMQNNSQASATVLFWAAEVDLSSYQLREASQWSLIFYLSFPVTKFIGKASYVPSVNPRKEWELHFELYGQWLVPCT